MPKFGALTNPSIDILKEIKTFKNLGLDFVEIGIEGPKGEPEILMKDKKQILNLLKKYGMSAIGHTSFWIQLGSNYEEVRKGYINHCKKVIRVAHKLKLPVLNFHAYSKGMYLKNKETKMIILDNHVKSLQKLVNYAKKYKIILVLENMPESDGIHDINDFGYIIDRVPGLKVHLDIGHALCTGTKDTKNVIKWIRKFRTKLYHIHIHDNSGKEDEHKPLGKGKLNYKKVIRELKKINYDKTITFEIFTKNRNHIKYSMNKVKRLLK